MAARGDSGRTFGVRDHEITLEHSRKVGNSDRWTRRAALHKHSVCRGRAALWSDAWQKHRDDERDHHQVAQIAVDIVEREHHRLPLHLAIDHRQPLLLTGDQLMHVVEAIHAGHMWAALPETPGVEYGEMVHEVTLAGLLEMREIGRQGRSSDRCADVAHHREKA